MKRQSFRRPSFRRAACTKSDFLNNYPKYAQNCFIFGYNMCFNYPDRFSFSDFWYFNLGGNFGPPKFFKILSFANLRFGHKFLKYTQNYFIFAYNVCFQHKYQSNVSGFWIFNFGGNYGAPFFQNSPHVHFSFLG